MGDEGGPEEFGQSPSAYQAMMQASGGPVPMSGMTGGPSLMGGSSYGAMGAMGGGGGPPRMYMMNNQLNTIEEEKHETQNSAYFRENGDETDQSVADMKKSKILGDLHESSRFSNNGSPESQTNKMSPVVGSKSNKSSAAKQKTIEEDEEDADYEDDHEEGEDQGDDDEPSKPCQPADKQLKDADIEENYENDDDFNQDFKGDGPSDSQEGILGAGEERKETEGGI
jgi:hypothetical protein